MANSNPYSIDTYRKLLTTLERIEREEFELRNRKILYVIGGSILGLLIVIFLLNTDYSAITVPEAVTSYGAAIAIGPAFGFMYYSTQAELLSTRKEQFWSSLKTLFNGDSTTDDFIIGDSTLDINEVRKLLMEKLKEKLNEKMKYDY